MEQFRKRRRGRGHRVELKDDQPMAWWLGSGSVSFVGWGDQRSCAEVVSGRWC